VAEMCIRGFNLSKGDSFNKIVKRTAKSIATIDITGYEIKSACDNKKDMDSLYSELGFFNNEETSNFDDVCNLKLPSTGDILSKLPSESDINVQVDPLKNKIYMMKDSVFENIKCNLLSVDILNTIHIFHQHFDVEFFINYY
jgi:hypothetical protein